MNLLSSLNQVIESTLNSYNLISQDMNVIIDPEKYYELKYRIITASFGIIISKILSPNNSKNIKEVINTLQKIPGNIFTESFKYLSKKELSILTDNLILLEVPKDISVMDLYESTLSQEFEPCNGIIKNIHAHSSIKRQGSYFTPHKLSFNCTKLAVDRYIEKKLGIKQFSENPSKIDDVKKLLLKTNFADFSSGPGSFLIAILNYYKQNIDVVVPIAFVNSIYAFDVDFIALEIARFEVCRFIDNYSAYQDLKNNYIMGNPLMNATKNNELERMNCFSKGFIYHRNLGINISDIKERFDIILGNPPWEKVRFEDKQFFSHLYPEIVKINKKNDRLKKIVNLEKEFPKLYHYYLTYKNEIINFTKSKDIKKYFPLTSKGEVNTYALFSELSLNHQNKNGFIGLLVKSSLVTSKANQTFFNYIIDANKLVLIADFINSKKIFNIDSRERFCYILFDDKHNSFQVTMSCTNIDDLLNSSRYLTMRKDDLELINPETRMLPNTSDQDQILFIKKIMNTNTIFTEAFPDVKFGRIVHYTLHANDIYKEQSSDRYPIYEGKFIYLYDSKYSDYKGLSDGEKHRGKASSRLISGEEKGKKNYIPEARYFIDKTKWSKLSKKFTKSFSLMWRSLTSATNKRTCISTLMPHIPSSQSIQLLQLNNDQDLILLCGFFNSIVFDYVVRMKLNGIDLTQTIIKQMPIPSKLEINKKITFLNSLDLIKNLIIERISRLYQNDYRLNKLFKDIDPCPSNNRYKLISEIDILVAKAYGINKKQFNLILNHFKNSLSNEEFQYLEELSSKFL